jgi:hypothetical protein
LILIKSVLKAILVYQHTLAYIPKGVLEKAHKLYFNYLWNGCTSYKGSHWVKWKSVAKPKIQGGWGLKNVHIFCQDLTTRSMWSFITKTSVWIKILVQKYMAPLNVVD